MKHRRIYLQHDDLLKVGMNELAKKVVDSYKVKVIDESDEFINGRKKIKVSVKIRRKNDGQTLEPYESYLIIDERYKPLFLGNKGVSLEAGIKEFLLTEKHIVVGFEGKKRTKYNIYKIKNKHLEPISFPAKADNVEIADDKNHLIITNEIGTYLYDLSNEKILTPYYTSIEDQKNGYYKVFLKVIRSYYETIDIFDMFVFIIDGEGTISSPIYSMRNRDWYTDDTPEDIKDLINRRKEELDKYVEESMDIQTKAMDEYKLSLENKKIQQ